MDPVNAMNDEDLKTLVGKTPTGKQVFDESLRKGWHVWPINTYVDQKRVPSEVEKTITGHAKGHLNRHVAAKVTCIKLRQPHSLGLAMFHRDLTSKPDAKAFVKLCRSALLNQLPRIDTKELANALYEGLVDRKCEHGLDAAVRRLSKLSLSADALRKSAEIINDRAITRPVSVGEISIQVGGFSYKMPTDIQGFQVNVMHAVISGDELVRKNLGMNLENAAQVLWGELLGWQSLHFGLRSAKAFGALLELAQGALAKQVISNSTQAETDLEVYTLLEALRHPVQSVSFRIALPNLKLIKDDGRDENEYDVVSVVLKQDKHVEVWVWGVTVEQNLTPKRNADMAKIQKLKDLLGQRWAADVRVVTCYVHKDGDDICLEIDGCQSRRIVAREVVTDTT